MMLQMWTNKTNYVICETAEHAKEIAEAFKSSKQANWRDFYDTNEPWYVYTKGFEVGDALSESQGYPNKHGIYRRHVSCEDIIKERGFGFFDMMSLVVMEK
jgi:hypothetical protein